MRSPATTVSQYLSGLPADRRAALDTVRQTILKNLDPHFEEGMQYGMIGYYIPHRVYPAGYHCDPKQPLPFAGLASQKNYMSLYLMSVYGEGPHWDWFHHAWVKTGKRLDMGKCCIRFKRVEDLALEVIGEAIARTTAREYIARYEGVLADARRRKQESSRARTEPSAARSTGKPKVASQSVSSGKAKLPAETKRAVSRTVAGKVTRKPSRKKPS
jgi:hypothetical protein